MLGGRLDDATNRIADLTSKLRTAEELAETRKG